MKNNSSEIETIRINLIISEGGGEQDKGKKN